MIYANQDEYIVADSLEAAIQVSVTHNNYHNVEDYLDDWPLEKYPWRELTPEQFVAEMTQRGGWICETREPL